MKNEKNTVALVFTALAILGFQILYYQFTVAILEQFAAKYQGWSDDCYLIFHHTVQFLFVFIPTFILHNKTILDFGYHIKDWKKGILWVLVGIVYTIAILIVSGIIFGFEINTHKAEKYIFQLFFSGLGEEIPYRAIPLVFLPLAYGSEPTLRIGSKIKIPIDIMIAALFFSIGHISFRFGQPGISYEVIQLVHAFGIGITIGMIFKKSHSIWLCMIAHGISNILCITF